MDWQAPWGRWKLWRGMGFTQAGNGRGIGREPGLAVAAEGAEAVDAVTVGAERPQHAALIHV